MSPVGLSCGRYLFSFFGDKKIRTLAQKLYVVKAPYSRGLYTAERFVSALVSMRPRKRSLTNTTSPHGQGKIYSVLRCGRCSTQFPGRHTRKKSGRNGKTYAPALNESSAGAVLVYVYPDFIFDRNQVCYFMRCILD